MECTTAELCIIIPTEREAMWDKIPIMMSTNLWQIETAYSFLLEREREGGIKSFHQNKSMLFFICE